MKILPPNKGVVVRVEFYQPYPPDIGYFTFNGVGNNVDEIIAELCKAKRINPAYIRDKMILCQIDSITTGLTDYLIHLYKNEYEQRQQLAQEQMDDYLLRNPVKPSNSATVTDE